MIINCLNILEICEDYEFLRNAVSDERRRKADRFLFISDSYRSICAELLLQYSLFENKGQYVEINLEYNNFGKPFLKNMDDFSYNISHSGDWVVIAYGNAEVGIDIEKIQYVNQSIVDRIFTKEEKDYVYSGLKMEQGKRFTQIWTLKESYVKYLGTGFLTELNSFSINPIDCVVTNQDGEIQDNIIIKSKQFDINYYLSVCGKEDSVIINEILLENLVDFIHRKQSE